MTAKTQPTDIMKRIIMTITAAALLAACGGRELRIVAGTYTDAGSCGIYSIAFDTRTGEAALLDSCRAVNPSYLTASRNGKYIYAVSELGSSNAAVYALRFDKRSGAFTPVSTTLAGGTDPCYISTNGKIVVTADYGGTLSVYPIASDGGLKPVKSVFNGAAGGPDSLRQNTPHIHCAEFSHDGKRLFVSDFSADRILCFDVVRGGRRLRPATTDDGQQLVVGTAPGYGPRHIIFDRKGRHAYLIGELSGTVTVFDVENDMLTERQTIDADPYDGRGSADIHISPDGRYLYVSNRLKGDGIAIFSIDPGTGELAEAGYQHTGIHPRHFNITPDGRYLLCACRDDNVIEIYSRDKKSGLLTPTGKSIALSKPVCVQFVQ